MRKSLCLGRGFTLVELFVVLAVIGLLLLLLLPAVQAAREAARSTQCKSHLKGIGIALAGYQTTHSLYPTAFLQTSGSNGSRGSNSILSPHCALLPFLEQEEVYALINFELRSQEKGAFKTAAELSVSTFLCPSDAGKPNIPAFVGTAPNNYRFNMGSSARQTPTDDDGAFSLLRFTRPSEFINGLSKIAFLSEKTRGDDRPLTFDPNRDWLHVTVDILAPDATSRFLETCQKVGTREVEHSSYYGASWVFMGYPYTWYNHVVPPNSTIPDCANGIDPFGNYMYHMTQPGLRTARSMHFNGVHCLMGDGHVEFVSNSIAVEQWRRLGSRLQPN